MKSWSPLDAVTVLSGLTPPPVLLKRDRAYDTWKFTLCAPRKGWLTFSVSFICNPLYTERPTGDRKPSGGARGLMPPKAQGYPSAAKQLTPPMSAEEPRPLPA